ncbi:hypothetical protein V2W45_833136 [Cenococcum geophilum]
MHQIASHACYYSGYDLPSAPQPASGCQDTCKWSSEAVFISSVQADQPISTAHPLRLVFCSLPRIWELRFFLPRRRVCLAVQSGAARSNAPSQACAVSCSFVQFRAVSTCLIARDALTTDSSARVACFSFLAGGSTALKDPSKEGRCHSLALRTSICSMPSFNLLSVHERRWRRKFHLLGTILLGLVATLRHRRPALGYLQLQRLQQLPAASQVASWRRNPGVKDRQ